MFLSKSLLTCSVACIIYASFSSTVPAVAGRLTARFVNKEKTDQQESPRKRKDPPGASTYNNSPIKTRKQELSATKSIAISAETDLYKQENEALKKEIERLKTLTVALEKALQNVNSGELAPEAISNELKSEVENFKVAYVTTPNLSVMPILALLDKERKDTVALDVYSFVMDCFKTLEDETRYEKAVSDLGKFTDHNYIGKLVEKYEKTTKEQLRRAAIESARGDYEGWSLNEEFEAEANDSPVLNLIRIEPNKLALIKKDVWPYLTDLLKYSSLDQLSAVYHFLGVKAILPPARSESHIIQFFQSLEEHIETRKNKNQAEGVKFRGHVKKQYESEYKKEIVSYFGKNYKAMQEAAHSYGNIYEAMVKNQEALKDLAKKSPLLYLLFLDTSKLVHLNDDLFEALRAYVKYASLEDLQAITHKFLQGGHLVESRESAPRFTNYIYSQVQDRLKGVQKHVEEISKQDIKVFEQKYLDKINAYR